MHLPKCSFRDGVGDARAAVHYCRIMSARAIVCVCVCVLTNENDSPEGHDTPKCTIVPGEKLHAGERRCRFGIRRAFCRRARSFRIPNPARGDASLRCTGANIFYICSCTWVEKRLPQAVVGEIPWINSAMMLAR